MLRGLVAWPAVCGLFLALEVLGFADDLSAPVPLILVLVGARVLGEIGRGRPRVRFGLALVMGLAGPVALVWWPALAALSRGQAIATAVCAALLAVLLVPRALRSAVLRPLGLDPASPVHVVAMVAMVGTVVSSVVLFLELQGEPGASVPFYATDSIVSVLGDVALALAGVGFLLTRDLRATAARLGLRPLGARQLTLAAVAALALHVMVGGLEWAESVFLPGLYALEDRFGYEFVGFPPLLGALMVSLAAGVGEELLFRGALQPRVGIVLSAALFAVLHVQYQVPGILMIFLVGLTLGVLKERTSTTFTVAVHAIYDLGAFILDLV